MGPPNGRPIFHIPFFMEFPGLLAEREIIANAFIDPDFSPNQLQK